MRLSCVQCSKNLDQTYELCAHLGRVPWESTLHGDRELKVKRAVKLSSLSRQWVAMGLSAQARLQREMSHSHLLTAPVRHFNVSEENEKYSIAFDGYQGRIRQLFI